LLAKALNVVRRKSPGLPAASDEKGNGGAGKKGLWHEKILSVGRGLVRGS
jgi:hypothetical protein